MITDKEVNDALASAAIYVDTAWGGDGLNPSGVYRVVLDAYFTGMDTPQIYYDNTAQMIRNCVRNEDDFSDFARRWIDGRWSDMLDALADVRDRTESPHRKRYLQVQEEALRMLLELKKAELKMAEMPKYRAIVRACVGFEPEMMDTKKLREALREALKEAGYEQEDLHEAADAWSDKKGKLSGKEIKRKITDSIEELEGEIKGLIMPHLPEEIRGTDLKNIKIIGLPTAFFSASSNYLGGEFASGYEYNMQIMKSEPELYNMTMHEFLPGHHFQNVINQALWKRGMTGPEACITMMGAPGTALAEGIAVAAPYIMQKAGNTIDGVDKKIAMLRDQLDAVGRLNGSVLMFEKGKDAEHVENYVREECCFNEEWSKRYVKSWLKNPFLGKIYACAYGLGNKVVRDALDKLEIEEFLPVLYGVEGAVGLVTFKEAVDRKIKS